MDSEKEHGMIHLVVVVELHRMTPAPKGCSSAVVGSPTLAGQIDGHLTAPCPSLPRQGHPTIVQQE